MTIATHVKATAVVQVSDDSFTAIIYGRGA